MSQPYNEWGVKLRSNEERMTVSSWMRTVSGSWKEISIIIGIAIDSQRRISSDVCDCIAQDTPLIAKPVIVDRTLYLEL